MPFIIRSIGVFFCTKCECVCVHGSNSSILYFQFKTKLILYFIYSFELSDLTTSTKDDPSMLVHSAVSHPVASKIMIYIVHGCSFLSSFYSKYTHSYRNHSLFGKIAMIAAFDIQCL